MTGLDLQLQRRTPLILAVRTALAAAVPDGPWLLPIQLILEAMGALFSR